jgi:hypothetical protein
MVVTRHHLASLEITYFQPEDRWAHSFRVIWFPLIYLILQPTFVSPPTFRQCSHQLRRKAANELQLCCIDLASWAMRHSTSRMRMG